MWPRRAAGLHPSNELTMLFVANTPETFWSRVDQSGDCWEWTGARFPRGYGTTRFEGKNWYSHRLAWVLTNGPIPAGLQVCHTCDNPPCCRPEHLFLGTIKENLQDASAKGRLTRSAETRERMGRWQRGLVRLRGQEAPCFGRRHTDEEKATMKAGWKRRLQGG